VTAPCPALPIGLAEKLVIAAPAVVAGTALLYEVILTAFLMFVITAVATDTRAVGAAAAIAIGVFGYALVRGQPALSGPSPSSSPPSTSATAASPPPGTQRSRSGERGGGP
jgi:Major intrinsic protein